jgi:SAM-dependent methyltransferase
MHPSARKAMSRVIASHLSPERHYRVVDFGSRVSDGQRSTHRDLLEGYNVDYVGVDIEPGRNVDVVMPKPYTVPLRTSSVDIVLSGQVFEHIPFFWASFLELARILRPGGLILLTVPSRGHTHDVYDCWRVYPDGLRALAAMSLLELLEGGTDFPPTTDGRRFDYARIDTVGAYWGDTVGVFRKPLGRGNPDEWLWRWVAVWWANRIGDLASVPGTEPRHPGRRVERPGPAHPTPSGPARAVVRAVVPAPLRARVRRARRAVRGKLAGEARS